MHVCEISDCRMFGAKEDIFQKMWPRYIPSNHGVNQTYPPNCLPFFSSALYSPQSDDDDFCICNKKRRRLVHFKALSMVFLLGRIKLSVIQALDGFSRNQDSSTKDIYIESIMSLSYMLIWIYGFFIKK